MTKSFYTQRRVEFCDTDAAGIAHFSAFLRFMEQAEHEFLRSVGLSVMQQLDDGGYISWPRAHVECDFQGPARFEELLKIQVEVMRLGFKSMTYRFTFTSTENSPIACGQFIAVCCKVNPKRNDDVQSIEIPESIRDALLPYLNS